MQIVAISDTHHYHRDLVVPPCDLLIHAGDLTNNGEKEVLADFLQWTQEVPAKDVVFIGGNHDLGFSRGVGPLPANVHYLQDSHVTIDGLKIYGFPWVPYIHGHFEFELPRDADRNGHPPGTCANHLFQRIPLDTDILVSQAPPHGILDNKPYYPHWGSKLLLRRLQEVKPTVHIFGHVHEANGFDKHNGVRHYNVAVHDKDLVVCRPPTMIWVRSK